jgi:hypothetical protein
MMKKGFTGKGIYTWWAEDAKNEEEPVMDPTIGFAVGCCLGVDGSSRATWEGAVDVGRQI